MVVCNVNHLTESPIRLFFFLRKSVLDSHHVPSPSDQMCVGGEAELSDVYINTVSLKCLKKKFLTLSLVSLQ